jgi:hypothetical protein
MLKNIKGVDGKISKIKDYSGQIHGNFIIISFVDRVKVPLYTYTRWLCKCLLCEKKEIYSVNSVITGKRKSSGCLNIKHGDTKNNNRTRLYVIWSNLKQRCYNKNNTNYKNYGGRGIKMDGRWLVYKNFVEDMGEPPTKDYTLDRIDNNKNYGSENCKWSTRTEQNLNKRNNKKFLYKNEELTLKQLVEKYSNLKYNTVVCRLRRGWSIHDALTKDPNFMCMKNSNPEVINFIEDYLNYIIKQKSE